MEELNESLELNLNEIYLSMDEAYHIYRGKPLYDKRFKQVMSFHPPGVAAVKDDEGAYHIDLKGEPLYKKRFLNTFGYYDGIATVEDHSGWYHINIDGKPIYNERYVWVGNFQEARCPVRDNLGNYFHIKKDGNLAYSEKYKYVGDFKYGIAVIYDENGLARHINKDGHFIHEKGYIELGVFHKGYATAKDNIGAFHIDKNGNPLYKERYKWVEPFYNGLSFVCKPNDEKIIINEKGQIVQKIVDESSVNIKNSLRKKLMNMLVGYWKTQILYSIVKFEVLDYIKEGCDTFNKLKSKIKIPEPSLKMIVNVLKIWNFIYEKDGIYVLKYLGDLLTEDNLERLKYAALMWGDEHYLAMSKLFEALKTHKPQFKKIFGQEIFQYLNKNKKKCALFNKAMEEYSLDYDEAFSLYDFKDSKIILDVGGGSGVLLKKVLERDNNIEKGVLFDLPSVIKNAQDSIEKDAIKNKIKFIPGNFFENIPIKADTIVISRVLHDWNDNKAIKILKNIYNSLETDGKLLILEIVVPENPQFDIGTTLNFNLLVCVGGKERTLNEFNEILKKAGLKITEVKSGRGIVSLIIVEKLNER